MARKILLLILLLTQVAFSFEKLPMPKTTGRMSLEQALYYRRSERSFLGTPLTPFQISQLLWAAQGITEPTWGFRTTPSAGATYPLTIYVVKKDGVYMYIPRTHSLEKTMNEDKRELLVRASLGQRYIGDAPVVFVITADFDKTAEKYGNRAERYVLLEAGHAAQNLLLQAVSLGLGGVAAGSFYPDAVSRTLSLPFEHNPLYLIPIGYINK